MGLRRAIFVVVSTACVLGSLWLLSALKHWKTLAHLSVAESERIVDFEAIPETGGLAAITSKEVFLWVNFRDETKPPRRFNHFVETPNSVYVDADNNAYVLDVRGGVSKYADGLDDRSLATQMEKREKRLANPIITCGSIVEAGRGVTYIWYQGESRELFICETRTMTERKLYVQNSQPISAVALFDDNAYYSSGRAGNWAKAVTEPVRTEGADDMETFSTPPLPPSYESRLHSAGDNYSVIKYERNGWLGSADIRLKSPARRVRIFDGRCPKIFILNEMNEIIIKAPWFCE